MYIALVGEAYGKEEEEQGRPFVGPTGWHLNRILDEVGIRRSRCLVTNVFNLRPKWNKIEALCGPKGDSILGYPPISTGRYIHQKYQEELNRLGDELLGFDPNIIVALGNTAMWALTGRTLISKYRGTVQPSTHTVTGFKVLATYHPAAIFRNYEYRPIIVFDLDKALRESEFPEIKYPTRELWIEPTLEDLDAFHRLYIEHCEMLSVDIESSGSLITCIGFATSSYVGIVIPFYDFRAKNKCYWKSVEAERQAWYFVRKVLSNRTRKVFQNGLFDIAFLWRAMGIEVNNAAEDTMLLHHALQPESRKDLGFLGSLYTDERAWKHMRTDHETIKRDD